ncbi:AraC family transcriptional regulator [Terrimonas sp.]|uniref:AraC family transcriptional regulator n=1 Tax=Terrimonas sp. TaxID=1914338 RepID=UPI000D520791|nr:AraC family transcriptional regulator [Terrimonas sp.]PVD50651.1 AraC family transcriptional regulator [Terrimonas sp.]
MKSALQKTSIPDSKIFVARELKEKHFDPVWHAHGEYQLFMVLKGSGTRFIGNTVKSFKEGDTTFIAPGVPHLWRNDALYFEKGSKQSVHGLVIYFKSDFMHDLLDKEELQQIKTLFIRSKKAIEFEGEIVQELHTMMQQLTHAHGTASVIALLQILDTMASTKEYSMLHNADYVYKLKDAETKRINLVYNYVAQHFDSDISLQEAAKMLSMTPTSFSRYFRIKTGKSFSEFVTELRIKHACKLLVEDDSKTISQVGNACGFNTLSNFNKQFKTVIKLTPKIYRNRFSSL